ncbi:MAG TPA: serine/threonine-protein kinase [Labilithrix sp.]|nr:serine/threonine-protein kinase [Labilithrix sp.]
MRPGGSKGGGLRLVPGLGVRAGQTVAGKYRVEKLLHSGASGLTLAARNVHLREPVVLEILASYTDGQEEVLERRLRKARRASQLRSAHVAHIVDIGVTEDGMPYIASEALQGRTMEAELERRGPLPVAEATRWILEACEGLAEAHAMGLVHGDLTPKNIFLAEPKPGRKPAVGEADEADGRILKLLDFSATSPLEAISDQTNAAFCTSPAYLAPEQIQDPDTTDARADVWALGVLLYELLSGSLPFTADTVSGVIVAVVYDTPTLLTQAPYALAKVVARCLEKDPTKRPQDVYELAASLAAFAGADGTRLSERVAVALDAPPPSPRAAEASGSIAPLSVVPRPAAPTTTRRRPREGRRPARWPRTKALIAAAATLGAIGFGLGRIAMTMQAEPASVAAELAAPAVAEPGPVSTTTVTSDDLPAAADEPSADPEADASLAVDTVFSFAPSVTQPIRPTPLATADDPAAAEAPAPPLPLPPAAPLATPPRSFAAPHAPQPPRAPRSRLPAGLPTTREEVVLPPPAGAVLPPLAGAAPPRPLATAPRNNAADASYLRGFLSDRK